MKGSESVMNYQVLDGTYRGREAEKNRFLPIEVVVV